MVSLLTVLLIGCGNTSKVESGKSAVIDTPKEPTLQAEQEGKKKKKFKIKEDGLYAQIKTAKGTITLKLEYEKAPLTVMNFVGLAEGKMENKAKAIGEPYYDGLKFHRVVPDFVIQGGDPAGNGSGGPGYQFQDEFHEDLTHNRAGALSMANSGPATNGSQFFITHKETSFLDFKHSVFGYVVDGQDVVNAIREGDVMETVTIIRKGKSAKNFEFTTEAWTELKAGANDRLKAFRQNQAEIAQKLDAKRKEGVEKAKGDKEEYKKWMKAYAESISNGKEVKEAGDGLYYFITEEGDGNKPVAGNNVNAKYSGYFPGGRQFDAGTFEFELVNGGVIQGWHVGFAQLKKGSKATLVIPYWLGYGPKKYSTIPAYSTLVFDVELLGIR
ncbi:MAG: peptidylprolyl isomerase [Bacteroidetes bacterium]|nr:peptidylprolyl isomerase [Bacteroidota bacterium]